MTTLVLALGFSTGTPVAAAEDPAGFDLSGSFYDTRDLPAAEPGRVLRAEPSTLPLAVTIPGADPTLTCCPRAHFQRSHEPPGITPPSCTINFGKVFVWVHGEQTHDFEVAFC